MAKLTKNLQVSARKEDFASLKATMEKLTTALQQSAAATAESRNVTFEVVGNTANLIEEFRTKQSLDGFSVTTTRSVFRIIKL